MLFKDYHIPMIRSGSKTVTRREWADGYTGPNVGSVVMAAASCMCPPDVDSPMLLSKDQCDCFICITGHRQEALGDISEESARREGDYDGVEDFKQGYEDVYGEGSWDPSKIVDVVEFEYVGRSPDAS
jgi:hypothetical protein